MFSRVSSRQKGNDLLIFVCGLFCAFATGVRLSYLVIDPAFAIGILLDSSLTEIRARLKRLLWFSSGFLLGSAPIFIVFLLAPQEFYYGNFTYIRLNTIYRELLGHSTAMTLAQKLKYFFEMVLTNIPSALVYAMAIVAATHQAVRYWRRFSSTITALLTLFLLGIFLLVASFSPTPL